MVPAKSKTIFSIAIEKFPLQINGEYFLKRRILTLFGLNTQKTVSAWMQKIVKSDKKPENY